ncbi:MAG: peptidylprolyl isomerase [Myxococcota bacterium]|jgi:peptidyl-prolyl cis-trans isomerase SurA|nr:peptidylprolyl isomerase [Myxococcota bacterium]
MTNGSLLRRFLLVAVLTCAAAILSNDARAVGNASGNDGVVDRIAAVVDDDIILLSEVREAAAPALRELARSEGETGVFSEPRKKKALTDALQRLIDGKLIEQQAKTLEMTVTTEEVDRAIANIARENGVTADTIKQAVTAQGMDFAQYRNSVRQQILHAKVRNLKVRTRVKIADAEARQYYNGQVREVRSTGSFEAAHILVRVPKGANPTALSQAKRRAEELLSRIRGGEDFEAVAKTASEDESTRSRGGRLGTLRPGTLPQALARVLVDLEAGETSGIVRTSAGFHILRVIERQALGVLPFAEVRTKIVEQLTQDEMIRQDEIWLKELRQRAFIEVRL